MAASIVAAASAKSTNLTDVTSLTISKPTGTAQGDFMVAIVCTYNTTISAPAGWTTVDSQVSGDSTMKSYFFTKFAGASEASTYQFTWSGGASAAGGIITYRDTSGLSAVGTGTNPAKASATTTDPVTPPTVSNVTNPGFGSMALCWHDNGSTGVTATGSGTEYWDVSTTDGSPSTHERGTAAYSGNNVGLWKVASGGNFNPSAAGFSINPTGSITGSTSWTWVIADEVYSTSGASDHTGATSSGTGSVTSNPSGSGASTLHGATSSGTGQHYITGSGGSNHTGATSSGTGEMHPKGSGSSILGGAQSAGTGVISGTKMELKVDGVWVDITDKLRHSEGVTITRGKSASGSSAVTTTCSFRLDNRGHEFNPFNVNGAYYGYLNRNTEIRLTKQEVGTRFWGEISSFEFGTDRSGNDLYVDVEAGGILRRLEQGEGSAKSPLYREIIANASTYSLSQYWPMEERDGTSFANHRVPINNALRQPGSPLTVRTGEGYAQFAQYQDVVSSEPIPQIGASRISSAVIGGNPGSGDGTTVSFVFASPGGMTADSEIFRVFGVNSSGEAGGVRLNYTGTNTYSFHLFNPGSLAIESGISITTVGRKGLMFFFSFQSTSVKLWWRDLETGAYGSVSPLTHANLGTWGQYGVMVNAAEHAFNEASSAYIGHIAVWGTSDITAGSSTTPTDLPVFNSLNAYLGENAATRFTRLCEEEGVNAEVYGGIEVRSIAMGYQKPGTFTQLLRECEATDGGLIYEMRDDFGLGYRPLSTLYNQDPAVELDFEGGHLIGEFKPKYDDQDLTNEVTVTREGGTSATYEITSGRMSTAASPDGIGRYDTSVTLSLEKDEHAYRQAGWRAFKGSLEEVRVIRIQTGLELPSVEDDDVLTEALLTVDVGDRLTVANCPEWLGARDNTLDQILDGYTERWDPTEHRWTYNTSPAKPYAVARAKPTVGSGFRVGFPAGTFLLEAVDGDDTEITIVTTLADFMGSVDSYLQVSDSDGDFSIEVGGEKMTVTAVTDEGPYGVSFTGHRWALTVTRGENGVARSHDANTAIRIWDRPTVAL